jgi:signal transduction histidine kinase
MASAGQRIPGLRGLHRLGLQRRIMLYVAFGLALMFGALAVIGLGAIDQATRLVFRERLATAYTTAGILERDFARSASDTIEAAREVQVAPGVAGSAASEAATMLAYFDRVPPYLFFRVSGLWLLDRAGELVAAAGSPGPRPGAPATAVVTALRSNTSGGYVVEPSLGPVAASVSFAAVGVVLPASIVPVARIAVLSTVSRNATTDYDPQSHELGPARAAQGAGSEPTGYHLEVVDPAGIAVLGIGADERPGEPSRHFPEIRSLIASGGADAMLHTSDQYGQVEPHVMAVVPLIGTPFYIVLEQAVDVALALPRQLEDRLLITTVLGFTAALTVAWVTTRHVVKPTEELTAAAGRIASGDLTSPITVHAEDEIGLLAERLEAMRQQLRTAREASVALQSDLERRVTDRTARLNLLLGQTIGAQEAERLRLARELHDETAQSLAALAISLDRARDALRAGDPEASARIAEARGTSERLLDETRRLILGLRPASLDDLGLVAAIRAYADAMVASRGIEVTIDAPDLPRIEGPIEIAVFRIVQEALANVARHADARTTRVELSAVDGDLVAIIADDGVGFEVDGDLDSSADPTPSFGLLGMRERVRLLGGTIEITSRPGGGTRIVVHVPISGDQP